MKINISPLWSKLGIEDEVSLVQQLYDVYFGEETNIGEIVHINGFQAEQYIRRNANVCSFRNKDTIKNFIDHQVVTRVDHDGSTFPYFDKTLETDIYKVIIDWDKLSKYAGILQDCEADESYGLAKQKQLIKSTLSRIDEANKTKKFAVTERIYRFPLEKKCNSQGVNAIVLDGLFWRKLVEFLSNPQELRNQAEEDLRSHEDNTAQKQGKERLTGFINKITEEEERYGKAYGVGTLDFEQFRELMKDAKRRKSAYLTQLNRLSLQINQEQVNTIELDEMCQEATKVLKGLDYSNKVKVVRDIIDRITIKERSGVEVCGHIPLFAQKLGYEPTSRDSWLT